MGWQPNYQTEGRIYARYLLDNKPDAKIGCCSQTRRFTVKDLLKGLKDGLGDKSKDDDSQPSRPMKLLSLPSTRRSLSLRRPGPMFSSTLLRPS